jgi:hypothetical protein
MVAGALAILLAFRHVVSVRLRETGCGKPQVDFWPALVAVVVGSVGQPVIHAQHLDAPFPLDANGHQHRSPVYLATLSPPVAGVEHRVGVESLKPPAGRLLRSLIQPLADARVARRVYGTDA